MKCRFCNAPAIVVITLSKGCICYPDDREQALCAQHLVRATPLGDEELKEDLTAEQFFKNGGKL
jgi:hypothetical protein